MLVKTIENCGIRPLGVFRDARRSTTSVGTRWQMILWLKKRLTMNSRFAVCWMWMQPSTNW
jgi:hypothetical protein